MGKKDPLDPKNITTNRFQVSVDELEARMQRRHEKHVAPAEKAAEVMGDAVYRVLARLGVHTNQDPEIVKAEQEALGITIWDRFDEEQPQLNGFYIHKDYDEYTPFAWVGDAFLDTEGKCWCTIWWFGPNIEERFGGFKVETKQ